MTVIELEQGDGVWDGEWLSWEWVNSQMDDESDEDADCVEVSEATEPFQSREGFPYSLTEQGNIFLSLVDCASSHFQNTGRYLQIWGELGELYAELRFGLRRHGSRKAGSDGTIGGVLVEVKTVSPEKTSGRVFVKRSGDFEQLLVIRINSEFQFQGLLLDRSELKGTGSMLMSKVPQDSAIT